MYAIIKTGGKQYRVEEGESLLVERLPAGDGETVALDPLLIVDGADVIDGDELSKVKVEAKVLAHERGPKLRIVKFKPKRGYKRRTGHRQELTRIEVTSLGRATKRGRASTKAAKQPRRPRRSDDQRAGGDGWRIRRASAPAATAVTRTPSASASRCSPARP